MTLVQARDSLRKLGAIAPVNSADKIIHELFAVLADAIDANIAQHAELVDRLKLEAQCHAQEARTANATLAEIYQLCSGGKGEPGNWHGAEPVRALLGQHAELIAKLRELLDESKAVDVPNVLVKQLGLLGRFMRLAEDALLDAQPAAMTGESHD
jgi:hypothetical protein